MLLLTGNELLPNSEHWNFGGWSKPIYTAAVGYSILVTIIAFVG